MLGNAPPALVDLLVREDEISIAGPLLRRSPVVAEPTLIEVARMKGQGHLLAMSQRPKLPVGVTDVIVRRGDREVVRRVAGNAGAQFSQIGYSSLIKRAGGDGVLTLTVGQRGDLSAPQLKDLLAGSADIVRRRLFEVAKPDKKAAINQAMVEIIGAPKQSEMRRDFAPAQRAILSLHHAGELNEAALLNFAKAHKYEECVAALSAMSAARIATIDRLLTGDRHDPMLILGRAVGLEWATVRALIVLRLGPGRVPSATDIEEARLNFERLAASTAQRVVEFLADAANGVSELSERGPSDSSSKPQISRAPPLAFSFAAIARHGVAVPRLSPVGGLLRHPEKIRRARKMRERPGDVIVDIADEAKFA